LLSISGVMVAPPAVDHSGRIFQCARNSTCYGIAPNGTVLWSLYFPPNDDGPPVWIDTSPQIVSDGVMLMLDSADILHAYIEPACQVYLPMVGK
jgi:hypothetical protein